MSSSLTGLSNVDLNIGGPINVAGLPGLANVNLSVSARPRTSRLPARLRSAAAPSLSVAVRR